MNDTQSKIKLWMAMAGQATPDAPTIPSSSILQLRAQLILEEAIEFIEAAGMRLKHSEDGIEVVPIPVLMNTKPNLVLMVDALCDLMYVVEGSGVALGVDLAPCFDEVHTSNLSKIGGEVRSDGKVLKPPTYKAPDLAPIIKAQGQ